MPITTYDDQMIYLPFTEQAPHGLPRTTTHHSMVRTTTTRTMTRRVAVMSEDTAGCAQCGRLGGCTVCRLRLRLASKCREKQ